MPVKFVSKNSDTVTFDCTVFNGGATRHTLPRVQYLTESGKRFMLGTEFHHSLTGFDDLAKHFTWRESPKPDRLRFYGRCGA